MLESAEFRRRYPLLHIPRTFASQAPPDYDAAVDSTGSSGNRCRYSNLSHHFARCKSGFWESTTWLFPRRVCNLTLPSGKTSLTTQNLSTLTRLRSGRNLPINPTQDDAASGTNRRTRTQLRHIKFASIRTRRRTHRCQPSRHRVWQRA